MKGEPRAAHPEHRNHGDFDDFCASASMGGERRPRARRKGQVALENAISRHRSTSAFSAAETVFRRQPRPQLRCKTRPKLLGLDGWAVCRWSPPSHKTVASPRNVFRCCERSGSYAIKAIGRGSSARRPAGTQCGSLPLRLIR